MTFHKVGCIIALSCLLSMFLCTQVPLLTAVHRTDVRGLIVSVESPRTDIEYSPGQIVPVRVTVTDSRGLPVTNATVLVTSSYDIQFVHVPLLEVTRENQSEVAIYGPDPNMQMPQGQVSGAALVQLNNAGLVKMASSPGDWSLVLEIEPPTNYMLYQRNITIHVSAGPPITLYLIAFGWICVIGYVVFLVRKRIRRKRTANLSST